MSNITTSASLVGAEILNLVTIAMYNNPLAIYREYIQNAADSIGRSSNAMNGRVDIEIDSGRRTVTIRDNGPGLSYLDACRELIPVARSRKQRGVDRGFRGIGRLSGLAFADAVIFRTRANRTQHVAHILWDGVILRECAAEDTESERMIKECVSISKLEGGDWPDHFFEVEIVNIARHATGQILNRDLVQAYIGEVCPVPMDVNFPFSDDIEKLFDQSNRPLTLQIVIKGNQLPVTRRCGKCLTFSGGRQDQLTGFETLRIPSIDDGSAAVGWLAHSSYFGAIPKELGVRGLRVRQGNIQIGEEYVFDHLFRDERFNRWCVGEINILDPRIIPNGRRDYFEPSPHLRNLENHLESIIRRIITKCRKASVIRNRTRKLQSMLQQMEDAYDLATSGYLKAQDARILVQRTLKDVQDLEQTLTLTHIEDLENMEELKTKLHNFQPKRGRPPLGKVPGRDVATYQRIFHALTESSASPSAAKKIIESVLTYA